MKGDGRPDRGAYNLSALTVEAPAEAGTPRAGIPSICTGPTRSKWDSCRRLP